jgi:3-deoxy-manno-octulosonate cytidylyltransferase (CMP-KDO synthetase)
MSSIKVTAFIPARFHSSRLPYKVLHKLDNKSMIQWVYENTKNAKGIDEVVILTDNELVYQEAQNFRANVMMTSHTHESGTDRIAEASQSFPNTDVFVNVQGDQPFVKPDMIEKLIEPYLKRLKPDMATLACPLDNSEINDSNSVKVAYNKKNHAMFFTRSSIPFFRTQIDNVPILKHIGLYAYTKETLKNFTNLKPSKLEMAEGLEQLRALEEGYSIYVSKYPQSTLEINVLEDLEQAKKTNLINTYNLYQHNEIRN